MCINLQHTTHSTFNKHSYRKLYFKVTISFTADPEFGGHSILGSTITYSPSSRHFLTKITNIDFIFLLGPLSLCILGKKIFKAHPGLSGHASFDPKWPICPNQNFFWKNHYDFHVPLGPFQYAKFKKNLYSRFGALRMHYNFESKMAQLPKPGNFFEKIPFGSCYCSKLEKKSHQKEVTPFLGPKLPIGPKWYCFWKNHWPNFHVPLGPFLMQNFKKILRVDPKIWECTIFWPKMALLSQKRIFFQKTV